MGKKKTQRQQDFQKVKLKVGRKVLKAQNETKITVKAKQIVIKEQLKAKNHLQEATTRKRLTIPELLVHLAHYNPSMRYEGISGLSELLTRDSESVLSNVSGVLERLSPIFVDKDANVRRGCRNLLKKLFPLVAVDRMEPFFALPMAHLYCAMTHIDEHIRKDSLEVVDVCLRFYPSLVVRDAGVFLDHFLRQISTTTTRKGVGASGSSSSSSSTLLVSPTNQISTVKWRTEVFKRLAKVFEALSSEHAAAAAGNTTTSRGDSDDVGNHDDDETRGTSSTPVRVDDIGASVVRIAVSDSVDFRLRDCLRRSGQQRSSSAGSTKMSRTMTAASSVGVDSAALREFGETLVPLLLDSWVEASPADANLDARGRSKSVSEDVFDLFAAITSLLKLLLDFSDRDEAETEPSLRTTFSRKFLPDLAKRFIPFFPLHAPQNRKRPDAASQSTTTTAGFVNLAVCDVLTFDARALLKSQPPSWLRTVFDHLDRFFSASNLTSTSTHAADVEELTLAFVVIRRCLKSPVFVADYLANIFARLTSAFFRLSLDAQLLFLDFFSEFLSEFSPLLLFSRRSREEAFLSDDAIRSWLQNLPAYLGSLLLKGSSSSPSINTGEEEEEEEIAEHEEEEGKYEDENPRHRRRKNRVEIITRKIFGLFTSATRMGLGAFFPLRGLFDALLTAEVFPALTPDLQRRLVTLVGHVDVDGAEESLLATFVHFLSADFHRMHDFFWETIFFEWTTTRTTSDGRSGADARPIVALLSAVILKMSYRDADALILKRLGAYSVRVDGSLVDFKDLLASAESESCRVGSNSVGLLNQLFR